MKLLRICIRERSGGAAGLTLIEIIVVIAIFTILGGLGLMVSMDSYRGYAFRGERDSLITVLQKARSESMNNMCRGATCTTGKLHGVALQPGQYVLFQGTSYATRDTALDEYVASGYAGVHAAPGSLTEVVFDQLSGDVHLPGTITLLGDDGHTSTITVGGEGEITWTN